MAPVSNVVKLDIMLETVRILLQALDQEEVEEEVEEEEEDQEEVQLLCPIQRMASHSLQHDIQYVLSMGVKFYLDLPLVKRVEDEFTMVVH